MSKRKPDYSAVALGAQPTFINKNADQMIAEDIAQSIRYIEVNIDDIQFFALNPRRSINPKYQEIKDSIQAIGLESPLTIAKRPGDAGYVLYNGGNTRLKALKELYRETQDQRFYNLTCKLVKYQSDSDTLVRHMIENETRGEMLLIDKAMAALQFKRLYQEENNTNISIRDLADLLKNKGWIIQRNSLSIFLFTAEKLADVIPHALENGLGRSKIEEIRKTYHAISTYIKEHWPEHVDTIDEFQAQYLDELRKFDEEDEFYQYIDGALMATSRSLAKRFGLDEYSYPRSMILQLLEDKKLPKKDYATFNHRGENILPEHSSDSNILKDSSHTESRQGQTSSQYPTVTGFENNETDVKHQENINTAIAHLNPIDKAKYQYQQAKSNLITQAKTIRLHDDFIEKIIIIDQKQMPFVFINPNDAIGYLKLTFEDVLSSISKNDQRSAKQILLGVKAIEVFDFVSCLCYALKVNSTVFAHVYEQLDELLINANQIRAVNNTHLYSLETYHDLQQDSALRAQLLGFRESFTLLAQYFHQLIHTDRQFEQSFNKEDYQKITEEIQA